MYDEAESTYAPIPPQLKKAIMNNLSSLAEDGFTNLEVRHRVRLRSALDSWPVVTASAHAIAPKTWTHEPRC